MAIWVRCDQVLGCDDLKIEGHSVVGPHIWSPTGSNLLMYIFSHLIVKLIKSGSMPTMLEARCWKHT